MTGVSRGRHVVNGLGLVAVLAIGWGVAQTTPSEEMWQGPIAVRGDIGETLAGRNIEAVVSEVRVAETVVASNGWAGPTSGVWVVIGASVAAVVEDRGVSLGTAQLVIGSTTYSASERPGDATIAREPLSTGIPVSGPLMIEIPRDLVGSEQATEALVQLAANNDPRTDSIIVVEVDLTSLPVLPSLETSEPVWGAR
jgi:hypothetical protein